MADESTPPVTTPEPAAPVEPQTPVELPKPKRVLSKGRLAILIGAIALVICALVSIAVAYNRQNQKATCSGTDCGTSTAKPGKNATPTPSATPTPVSRLLDGAMVSPGGEAYRPLAVMIENHPDARPQSGLAKANWVYEAISEGGITRFMALFADPSAEDIRVGPVRSVRTYYLDFAREYNAFLAHVGGNSDALSDLKANGGVTDLDQFAVGAPTYARDFSRNVPTEHTMYSSTTKLWDYIGTKKYDKVGNFPSLPYVDDATDANRAASQTVTIDFSEATYAVKWDYDKTSNAYKRSMAGKTHTDADSKEQITAKNIILEQVEKQSVVSSGGKVVWKYTLTGSGKAILMQNGKATVGTWKRSGNNRTRYYDANGKELSLLRGTTWVEVVHSDTPVSY